MRPEGNRTSIVQTSPEKLRAIALQTGFRARGRTLSAPEQETQNTHLESTTWLVRERKPTEHSQGCYLVCVKNLILVLLIRTMKLVLIFIVGPQVLPSITPILPVLQPLNFWPQDVKKITFLFQTCQSSCGFVTALQQFCRILFEKVTAKWVYEGLSGSKLPVFYRL